MQHPTQWQALHTVLDPNRIILGPRVQPDCDDGRGDIFGAVDDLVDSWHSLSDAH